MTRAENWLADWTPCVPSPPTVDIFVQGHTHIRAFSGTGADNDIVVSSVRAYVSALNKLISFVSKSEKRAAEDFLAKDKTAHNTDEAFVEALAPVA